MSNISVEPDTIVKLLRCGLQRGSGHQLTFANATAQQTYFESRVLYSYTDFTYVRENNSIAVGQNVEDIRDCNYLMYQNKNFGNNKWFYAFITDLEYVNENVTRVYFETDSWQTWMWDFDLHPVFVEREHTNDDTVGANTVPESVETGEYMCWGESYYSDLDDLVYAVQVTAPIASHQEPFKSTTNFGGVPMVGTTYLTRTIDGLEAIMTGMQQHTDDIYNVYMIPASLLNVTVPPNSYIMYQGQDSPISKTKTVTKASTIGGTYTPNNNKLLTYPYSYLLVSNNNGSSNIFRYEYFMTTDCTFTIKGVPTVGGSVKLVPTTTSYTGAQEENGLISGKFPTCNWLSDNYTNWLTQNALNIAVGKGSAGITGIEALAQLMGAFATKSVSMGISSVATGLSSLNQVFGLEAQKAQHELQPASATGNTNGGDINVCSGKNGFFFYRMSIKPEMARVIDDYFSLYGYQTNRVKYPNLGMTINNVNYKGRLNWNYVKTIGCTFDAKNSSKMSRQDEINIQQMFDNGVTLWHNPATMYDYSQANTIVS